MRAVERHRAYVEQLQRDLLHREPPTQVPGPDTMDALVDAAKHRRRPRDVAIFLILRHTGMRRESVATLCVRHLDPEWGLRRVEDFAAAARQRGLRLEQTRGMPANNLMLLLRP